MIIKIILYCPDCQSAKIKKNGKKSCKKQNYFCKNCGRQFDTVYTDDWDSFKDAFYNDNHIVGKEIEGNNCRLKTVSDGISEKLVFF